MCVTPMLDRGSWRILCTQGACAIELNMLPGYRMTNRPSYESQALAEAAKALGLHLIVLFGSWAKGRPPPGPDSDVDIAVLGLASERLWDGIEALSRVFQGYPLDMVRLEDADPLFRHEIMHRGILLWGDPNLYSEFRAYAYRDFIDSADLFALEEALFKKKMKRLQEQLGDSP